MAIQVKAILPRMRASDSWNSIHTFFVSQLPDSVWPMPVAGNFCVSLRQDIICGNAINDWLGILDYFSARCIQL